MSIERISNVDLVAVDPHRINNAIDIYYHWKDLDREIKTFSGKRGLNFPSEISEFMAAYALGLYVNQGSGGDAYDMTDPNHPLKIEIKGSSSEQTTAPNSFSPSEDYDELVFARLEKRDDVLKIYRLGLSSKDISKIQVNRKETVADQQRAGKRPRFSIYNMIVKPNGLEPDVIFNLRTRQIERR